MIGAVLAMTAALGIAPAGAATLNVSTQPPGPVPAEYQSLYDTVAAEVHAFTSSAPAAPAASPTVLGTELFAANGNIGPSLLSPRAITGVEEELDALQALGVGGVTVDVSFPLLLPSTPNSAGYLTFYERVARQIRARHMVFSVEENPVYSGTPLTTLSISYAGLTLSRYAAEQRTQAQLIIDDLKPDYLSVLTEPDTFADTLHLPLDTASTAVTVVRDELAGLRRGHTLVGAGSGTWSTPAIDRALLAQTSIDYLDVHVYPIGPADVANLQAVVAAAKDVGRPLVMDETWLNKPEPGAALGPAGAPQSLKVKSYSFWEPLDETWVSAMADYVRAQGFAYVSFFDGARAFFGYLTWSPALDAASYQSFSSQYNQLVGENMRSLTISGSGEALREALAG